MSKSKTLTTQSEAESMRYQNAWNDLKNALRKVLNSPEYIGLSNISKAEILLELENDGEYNPLG